MIRRDRRLAQVYALRTRRAERERVEKLAEAARSAARRQRAEHDRLIEADRRDAADLSLKATPADPQVQLWRRVAGERLTQARQSEYRAAARLEEAERDLEEARLGHERLVEREAWLSDRIARKVTDQRHLRDERAVEEQAEARR